MPPPSYHQPSGSVAQLMFGLVVCFLTFAMFIFYAPFVQQDDDNLAQLCQVQIFFALLCSVMLKYTPEHMHCTAVFMAPSTPPNTGLLAYQATDKKSFRISATGVLLELEAVSSVVKKLKLVGSATQVCALYAKPTT